LEPSSLLISINIAGIFMRIGNRNGTLLSNSIFQHRGGVQAFKLDTLLKLSDVKGSNGKTTLLHFVDKEIICSEGVRAARTAKKSQITSSLKSDDRLEDSYQDSDEHYRNIGLQVVSGLGGELENVRKAAILDADGLVGIVSKLSQSVSHKSPRFSKFGNEEYTRRKWVSPDFKKFCAEC
ncbi:formin 5, partial [Olea europaea subsp. europaea]